MTALPTCPQQLATVLLRDKPAETHVAQRLAAQLGDPGQARRLLAHAHQIASTRLWDA